MMAGMVLCALGMATGVLLIAASVIGFGRCLTCRRFAQLTGSEGMIRSGDCCYRQTRDFCRPRPPGQPVRPRSGVDCSTLTSSKPMPLAPNDDPTIWAERLEAEADDLNLVGHLPHLARLAGPLVTRNSDHSVIRFRQGGLVVLQRTDTGWRVAVVFPPEGG